MLGVPVETFRGNKVVMLAVAALGAMITLGWLSFDSERTMATLWPLVMMDGLLAFNLYWLTTVEVVIYDGGISSRTVLGTAEMRWDEVARFYYSATKQSVNFIPVGTYYDLRLESEAGKKIKFGNRAERMQALADQLVRYTLPPIYKRVAELYNSGAEVDFGAIKVSKAGFKARGIFGLRNLHLAMEEVADYRIDAGVFYVYRTGKRMPYLHAQLNTVPNAFALLALLDSLFQRSPEVAAP
jgi:hypothetical protein